jgi:hypothetical protein
VLYSLTRDLDFQHNAPIIVPAGVPIDLDAASRRQHEEAMGPTEPAAPSLVQILPAAPSPASKVSESAPGVAHDGPANSNSNTTPQAETFDTPVHNKD